MSFALLALLTALTVYRLTVYGIDDAIFKAPRAWVKKRSRWAGELISCPWCLSTWIGAPVAAVVVAFPTNRVVWAALLWFSSSAFTGILHGLTHKPKPAKATLLAEPEPGEPVVIHVDDQPYRPFSPPPGAVLIGTMLFRPVDTRPDATR